MSLTKLLLKPMKLFKKDVITFVIIRRHDLGCLEDKLRYIAVRPNASVSVLRQKVWHLLDLPDYCEEIIILKCNEREIPLTELRKGNDPQHPYFLEVYFPGKQLHATSNMHNMLTMGQKETTLIPNIISEEPVDDKTHVYNENYDDQSTITQSTFSNDRLALNKHQLRYMNNNVINLMQGDCKPLKSDLSCRMSTSSIMFKLQGRKSKDSFTNVLLKIQNDLSNLSNKLSNLENRIST